MCVCFLEHLLLIGFVFPTLHGPPLHLMLDSQTLLLFFTQNETKTKMRLERAVEKKMYSNVKWSICGLSHWQMIITVGFCELLSSTQCFSFGPYSCCPPPLWQQMLGLSRCSILIALLFFNQLSYNEYLQRHFLPSAATRADTHTHKKNADILQRARRMQKSLTQRIPRNCTFTRSLLRQQLSMFSSVWKPNSHAHTCTMQMSYAHTSWFLYWFECNIFTADSVYTMTKGPLHNNTERKFSDTLSHSQQESFCSLAADSSPSNLSVASLLHRNWSLDWLFLMSTLHLEVVTLLLIFSHTQLGREASTINIEQLSSEMQITRP